MNSVRFFIWIYDNWKDEIPTIHLNDVKCYYVTYIINSLVSCWAKTCCFKTARARTHARAHARTHTHTHTHKKSLDEIDRYYLPVCLHHNGISHIQISFFLLHTNAVMKHPIKKKKKKTFTAIILMLVICVICE